jgi:hypothetical protein
MGLISRSFEVGSSLITGGLTQVNEFSGGGFLGSGAVFSILISNISGNAPIWIGGTSGTSVPTSGRGLILYGSDPPVEIRVNSVEDIKVTGVSGQLVSWVGLVK